MNFTLHQLRIFQKVASTLNITKAAEELYLTQPAVSIQLKHFQEQFDLPLLETVNKKIYLTDFGREIVAAAESLLDGANALQYRMHAFEGRLAGKLKLSVVSTGKYIAPYFLTDFMKENPGVELVMDVTNKSRVISSLEQNEVDFALVSVLPEQLRIDKITLMQNKLFLVGNRDHGYRKKEYDKRIFEQLPLIYREAGSGTRHVMEGFFRKNRLPLTKKMELTSNEAVKQAVIAGLGFSIMPLIGIRNELQSRQLEIIPVKGFPVTSVWTLIWLKAKKLSPVAAAYLQFLKSQKQSIIEGKFDWYEKY
ncbi:MAG: hypothetical protein RL213_497 [Bacteroidota bacterium]|jgi:DNA-binding transcriptional LysR family regulator